MEKPTGQCLCGGVRFELAGEAPRLGLCHCKMCRRWGGGMPLAAVSAEVKMLADAPLRWWKSSPWGERGFCGECGSSLFWRAQGGGHVTVLAGALDDGALPAKISEHIFADDKPAFYDTDDDAPRLTGAMFTARVLGGMAKQFGEGFLQDAMQKCREHNGETFAAEVQKHIAAQDGGS